VLSEQGLEYCVHSYGPLLRFPVQLTTHQIAIDDEPGGHAFPRTCILRAAEKQLLADLARARQ
jgi:hypothetical protein